MTHQPRSLKLESHQHIKTVFSKTTKPIELKFHMKTTYDRLAKRDTNCFGHMTKMATAPICGKTPLNIFFSGTKRSMALGLGMYAWGYGPYKICTYSESRLTLTYTMVMSNRFLKHLYGENIIL